MSTIAALDLSGRPGLRLNLNNLDRLISDWDLLSTPLPLQSLNLAPNSESSSSSNSNSVAPWQGYYVEGDIDGSWHRLCHAFMDYKVPPSFVYDSGNEALTHPLMNQDTNMYLAECQRSPR